ncbi:DNA polymerase-3 subunit alpha [Lactobacillus colini]|uniref:DNA-directed DNA polymerase n=1 Tax=Lactobacillus colini TaxID=1819254 RepID=A0ABS4ME48_9LACO|nr:DNA polymerase III subunit alpha [Lactobacillus colini]MBP2057972.1 DNA polymerase-3 subunit alpha [Lactobacillus colini]
MVAGIQNISSFSLLQSPITLENLLVQAKERGYSAVSLTDINVTYGLVDFFKKAKDIGIKPLLGMQININGLIDESRRYHLIIIAKDNIGYGNLLRLSSAINLLTDNNQNDRIVKLKDLKKYLEHLIIITPANQQSELRYLATNNPNLGSDYLRKLRDLLSNSNNLFLGVYGHKSQQKYINYVSSLSQQFKLPLVAAEDVQYLNPGDQFLKRTLGAIAENTHLQDIEELAKQAGSHYLRTISQLQSEYRGLGIFEALENTNKIAQMCNVEIEFQDPQLPKFKPNNYPSSKEYLHHLAQEGLKRRFAGPIPQNYQKRLDYELGVINYMGFDDYFLIVWDVINFAHSVEITTGPGRGSAAGSLVSYALRITEVDPIKYNLLFERFLNPARQQMPDIDLDIPDNRRDEVIQYMFNKYGMNHAAQILTFGTLSAKQVIRDVARIFGLNKFEVSRWTRALPLSKTKLSLSEAYKESNDLRFLVESSSFNSLLFKTAQGLEDLPRHYSIHAAGLVITDDSLAKIVGLQAGPLGIPVTQQTKKNVEGLGLLKIDFLGLRNLTILGDALELLKDEKIILDPNKIPLDDKLTLELFQKGNTDAVFQFESSGIKRVLRNLHPDKFEDIVAVNALYRPGPIQNIDHFIARKLGKEKVTYPDPSLKEILRPTYGILVYQEQVMQTAQVLAGFSLGEADLLRRAMSKKDMQVIQKEKNKFINGAIKLGHPRSTAEKVYNYIVQFANYGFNRSHAVAYSEIAFWLAYLKVHYPAAFYTALLNSNLANRNKVNDYLTLAQEAGINVLPPSINESNKNFSLKNNKILVGLKAIKGLRNDFIDAITAKKKTYKSLKEFLLDIDSKYLNTDAIMNLIKAGAFDGLGQNRQELIDNAPDLIATVKMSGHNQTLFETLEPNQEVTPEPTSNQKSQWETEVMGFSTTANPLIAVQKYAKRFNAKKLNEFSFNENGIGVGKLIKLRKITTKKGDEMAFAVFGDSTSQHEFTIFPSRYETMKDNLKIGNIYLLQIHTQADRYDTTRLQYLLNNIRKVDFKE